MSDKGQVRERQPSDAASKGRRLAVFHYSFLEPVYLKKIIGEESVADVVPTLVDLLPVGRANYLGAYGLSIKKIAPAFGFAWFAEPRGKRTAESYV